MSSAQADTERPTSSERHWEWPEQRLVEAVRSGDRAALDELFSRYRSSIEMAAALVLGTSSDAEDAVQHAFIKTWQAAPRLDPGRPFGPWVRTIVRRTAIDIHRSRLRHQRPLAGMLELEPSAESVVDRAFERERVRAAVAALPRNEAVVVCLSHFESLTHEEIADELGVPVGTVKSRSFRAHRRLVDLLGSEGSAA